jgi:MFS family permease
MATLATERRVPTRVILAACLGSALEWYDFFLYGTASALVFAPLFFPKSDPIVGTLLSFLTFGVGFIVRPLGGVLFGILGDRLGRKPVLLLLTSSRGGPPQIECPPSFAWVLACVMRLPGGTLSVSQTLPPIDEPRPIVMRPRIVAPA